MDQYTKDLLEKAPWKLEKNPLCDLPRRQLEEMVIEIIREFTGTEICITRETKPEDLGLETLEDGLRLAAALNNSLEFMKGNDDSIRIESVSAMVNDIWDLLAAKNK